MTSKDKQNLDQTDDLEATLEGLAELQASGFADDDESFHQAVENNYKAKQAAEVQLDTDKAASLQNTAALLNQQTDDRDLANQILGQVQMANALAKFADVVSLTKLQYIKETKLYRALKGKKGITPDGSEIADVGTFDGFCQMLGLSRTKVDEDLANLRVFGEMALDNLTAMGIGYREMRQYRKLPEDQQQALIEVAKAGDKEAFVDLAEEIISKNNFEKGQLRADLDEVKADYAAQGELLSNSRKELDDTKLELEKIRRRIQTQKPNEVMQQLHIETSGMFAEVTALLVGKIAPAMQALAETGKEIGDDQRQYMASMLNLIESRISTLREEYELTDLATTEPDWMRPGALEEAEALVATQQSQEQ